MDVSAYYVYEFAGAAGNSGMRALIALVTPNGRVQMRFYPDNTTLPTHTVSDPSSATPIYYVSYPYYQYAGVLDLLRNEKPLGFYFTNPGPYLCTSSEPVGEEE